MKTAQGEGGVTGDGSFSTCSLNAVTMSFENERLKNRKESSCYTLGPAVSSSARAMQPSEPHRGPGLAQLCSVVRFQPQGESPSGPRPNLRGGRLVRKGREAGGLLSVHLQKG